MHQISSLRSLLASARTAEALEQLTAWAQTQSPAYRQAALLLQASWANNEQQANRGLIAYEEAERVRNRITAGALGLLDEIESGASAPKAVLEGLQKQFLNEQVAAVIQGGNVTNLSGSTIHVQGSKDVVIGSGNVITKKKIAGLARGQFLGIAAGLLLLVLGGYFAFDLLRERQEETFVSLQEIMNEIKMRGGQDATFRTRVEDNQANLERWLNTGMNALEKKQYPVAVENLEKVAAEVPLATVRQNLAFAYQQMGNTAKVKENLEQAKQIRESAPPAENTTTSPPEGQSIVDGEVSETTTKTNTDGVTTNGSENVNIKQGLIAYFPFSGSVKNVADPNMEVKNAGATFSEDRFGRLNSASHFKGGAYIEIPLNLDPKVFKTLSVCFWAKPVIEVTGKRKFVISNAYLEFWLGATIGMEETFNEAKQKWEYTWSAADGLKRPGTPLMMDFMPVSDEWTFVAVTYDNVAQKIIFYINDNRKEEVGVLGKPGSGVSCLRIGRDAYENPDERHQSNYKGFVDELRIYNRVLTDTEIDYIRKIK